MSAPLGYEPAGLAARLACGFPRGFPPRPDEPQACPPAGVRALDTDAKEVAVAACRDVGDPVLRMVQTRLPARPAGSRLFQSRGRVVPRVLALRGDGVRQSLKLDALGVTAPSAVARDPAAGLYFCHG